MGVRLEPQTSTCTSSAPSRTSTRACTSTVFDPEQRGRRLVPHRATGPTRAHAEMTVCLYLPRRPRWASCSSGRDRRTTTRSTPAGMTLDDGDAVRGAARRLRRQGRAARRPARRWPTRRRRSPNNPYAEGEVAPHVHRPGPPEHVRRRARRARTRRPARSSPRATTSSSSPATGTIRVGDEEWEVDGLRPARPLVGTAVLAGALVLPLAHRERRPRLRVHGQPRRPARRRRHPRRLRVGGRRAPPLRRRRARRPTYEGDEQLPRDASRPCCGRRGPSKEWKFTRRGDEPDPAAQPPPRPRRQHAA